MEKQSTSLSEPLPSATECDFNGVELKSLLANLQMGDRYALLTALGETLRTASDNKDEAAVRALRVLSLLCTFHMKVGEPGAPYSPSVNDTGRRSCLPSDFRGEQNDILAKIAPEIGHPALRARVSDVVWVNDRKHWQAAVEAVTAYCEVAEKRMSGAFSSSLEGPHAFIGDAVDYVHRALEIAAGSKKLDTLALRDTFERLYAHAQENRHYVHFVKLARVGKQYQLLTWDVIALDAELLVSSVTDVHPIATHPVWRLACDAHELRGDDGAKTRCLNRAVDETLRNREHVSLAARPHFTRVAIEELRQGGGSRSRIRALQKELRDLQNEAVDQAAEFSIPVDLSEEQQGTVKIFGELTLPDLLLRFGQFRFTKKLTDLRAEAEQNLHAGGVMAMFGKSYIDAEGKVIAETPPLARGEEPSDVQLKEQYNVILDLHRHIVANAFIEPARSTALTRFALEERHFQPIVEASPFVPPGHRHLFRLGFARFWQGDFPSALHILVPQIENSLRYVLLNADEETSKLTRALTQEDRSLSGLLQSMRSAIERIFDKDLANDMEMLFMHKPGPSLRHELAHGQLADGDCYGANAIYACWFVYHLTVTPLAGIWGEVIAPAIEAAAF
jgi:hypothetical protein